MTFAKKLTNEELATVSGGYLYETANDSRYLNVLLRGTSYYRCDRYGKASLFIATDCSGLIEKSWRSLGIEAILDRCGIEKNKYFLNGKEITRDEAWEYAANVVGKHLKREDWDW